MIDFIKKHKIAFIVGFVVILLYWLYKRGTASTSTAAPQDATAAYLAGLSQPSYMTYGAGGGTLSGSANVQPLVPLMNAVNQPGTSASGVPSFSNQTQEMTPNTPAPAVAPVLSTVNAPPPSSGAGTPAGQLPPGWTNSNFLNPTASERQVYEQMITSGTPQQASWATAVLNNPENNFGGTSVTAPVSAPSIPAPVVQTPSAPVATNVSGPAPFTGTTRQVQTATPTLIRTPRTEPIPATPAIPGPTVSRGGVGFRTTQFIRTPNYYTA